MMIYTNLTAIFGAVILTCASRFIGGKREFGPTD
jgi:hypothetical protein